ncbi:Succinyl-CoA synthetase, beta subunit [Moorella glycerini]|uniref:Succinyl-CoA ligase [ADP-forming] subunit beta n=1 Tax=Neomoorella stamsii TaxID=1266720 RepID=A0A9X7P7B8_9FIRM|nr:MULTISPECIES: ATP-grasp domain-containing protein [Moorella]PRR76660.1 Succinyl-CoA ligase [ADP-forming] subunit beta [Moorella stamsii]CEP66802.1 Succinyl-CoA synthetase, beta subunit [Moorella glycerini]
MYLYEYQGKELFNQQGLAIPRGEVITTPAAAREAAARLGGRVVIKAQVRAGGRGKAGLVKISSFPEEAAKVAGEMLGLTYRGETVRQLLVEEVLNIEQEFYLGISLDYGHGYPVMLLSTQGGMDIEEVARREPEALARLVLPETTLPPLYLFAELGRKAGLMGKKLLQVRDMLWRMAQLFYRLDALTVEVNPAVWCRDGRLVAADAKVIIDDAAWDRHPELASWLMVPDDPCQLEAQKYNLGYVRLDTAGEIGIIAGGAGLCLATMDTVIRLGGRPASFLDLGGGITAEQMMAAMEITLKTAGIKGIIVNVYGGINNCYTVAQGITALLDKLPAVLQVPLVVKMRGHSQEEGWSLLEKYGVTVIKTGTTAEAVQKLLLQLAVDEGGRADGYPA